MEKLQSGGTTAFQSEHPEFWQLPKLRDSALEGTATVYQKEFEKENTKNLSDRLYNALKTFKSILEFEKSTAKKYYISLNITFCQSKDSTQITDPPVTFRSEVQTLLQTTHTEKQLKLIFNHLVDEFQRFERNGSGWVVNHFNF